jgi:hypothetical protein
LLEAMPIAPFSIPAHRTGRADFRHPALRLASPRASGATDRHQYWTPTGTPLSCPEGGVFFLDKALRLKALKAIELAFRRRDRRFRSSRPNRQVSAIRLPCRSKWPSAEDQRYPQPYARIARLSAGILLFCARLPPHALRDSRNAMVVGKFPHPTRSLRRCGGK